MSRAQNLVKSFTPVNSKSFRLTSPNTAQNRDWSVSKRLEKRRQMRQAECRAFPVPKLRPASR